MKNYVHEFAKYAALVLLSALPFSMDAVASPKLNCKIDSVEVNFDGDSGESSTLSEKDE